MKPAEDPGVDYTDLVRRGYDRCAVTFAAARREGNPAELTLLTSRLGKGASVLDLGCGSGVPVTRALAEQFRVTGVDFRPSSSDSREATLRTPSSSKETSG